MWYILCIIGFSNVRIVCCDSPDADTKKWLTVYRELTTTHREGEEGAVVPVERGDTPRDTRPAAVHLPSLRPVL